MWEGITVFGVDFINLQNFSVTWKSLHNTLKEKEKPKKNNISLKEHQS